MKYKQHQIIWFWISFIIVFTNKTYSQNLEFEKSLLEIYPNPASDLIRIKTNLIDSMSKRIIYNSFDSLVNEMNLTEPMMTLNITDFSNGIYVIKLISEHKKVFGRLSVTK